MIKLNQLPKITSTKKKRLGKGHGSGKGKTGGRGTKGQKSRGKIPVTGGATQISLIRHLPLFRGKYRNKPNTRKPIPLNIKFLNGLPANSVVDLEFLIKRKIVKDYARETGVKILGEGNLTVALIIKLPTSRAVVKKIEKAGGKVDNLSVPVKKKKT